MRIESSLNMLNYWTGTIEIVGICIQCYLNPCIVLKLSVFECIGIQGR